MPFDRPSVGRACCEVSTPGTSCLATIVLSLQDKNLCRCALFEATAFVFSV